MSTTARPLTPVLIETLEYIGALIAATGYPPTMQELADDLCISKPTAHERVKELEARRFLTTVKYKSRSIRLTGACPTCGHCGGGEP